MFYPKGLNATQAVLAQAPVYHFCEVSWVPSDLSYAIRQERSLGKDKLVSLSWKAVLAAAAAAAAAAVTVY